MTMLCPNCERADLEKASVRLSGEIRKHPYTVQMEGLKCPNCGYSTVDSKAMVELGRLAADEYRRAHGLLTSDEIIALRHGFNESQETFARRIGVGVASIKRWELGKIQDKIYNDLILNKTKADLQVEPVQPVQVCTIAPGVLSGSTSNVGGYFAFWPAFNNSFTSQTTGAATYGRSQCVIGNTKTEVVPKILLIDRTVSTYAQSSDSQTESLAYA